MKHWRLPVVFAAGVLAGCMASGPPIPADSPELNPPPTSSSHTRAQARRWDLLESLTHPLVIDRTDVRIGTTVQYDRVPSAGEIHDLANEAGIAHLVLSLPAWPTNLGEIQGLTELPRGADVIVVLPDYPPNRAAADIWRYVEAPIRIVIVVPGPPNQLATLADLNGMLRLERIIAQMPYPSRSGFEQLQRPLSFRKLMD